MCHAKALNMFRFFHRLSLDAISKTLSEKKCVTLNKHRLESRKGIVPYECFDRIDKTNNTELLHKDSVLSKLRQSSITDKEYKHAIDCWNNTGCNTIAGFMMLYLKTHVLLSVDVFKKFRDNSSEYCEIDPCYTYSTHGLTWLCEFTSVELKYY